MTEVRAASWFPPSVGVFLTRTLAGLRAHGTKSELGESGPDVVQALAEGFSVATRWSLLASAGFMVLGFVSATRVLVAARQEGVRKRSDEA